MSGTRSKSMVFLYYFISHSFLSIPQNFYSPYSCIQAHTAEFHSLLLSLIGAHPFFTNLSCVNISCPWQDFFRRGRGGNIWSKNIFAVETTLYLSLSSSEVRLNVWRSATCILGLFCAFNGRLWPLGLVKEKAPNAKVGSFLRLSRMIWIRGHFS